MSFIEARLRNQSVPTAEEVPVAAGQAFEKGALGFLVNGEFTEAGTDPAVGAVTHVAQAPFGTNTTGFGAIGGKREFPPGKVVTTRTENRQRFRCEFVGALPATRGASYGVTRGTDGKWRIDFGKNAGLTTPPPLVVRYVGPVNSLPGIATPRLVEVEFV